MLMRAESGLSGRRRMEGSREHGSRDGGFVLHGRVKGRVGRVWRALAGFGARGLVATRGRVVGLCRRITGPPSYWRWCAFGTTFAHRAGWNVGFSRDFEGSFLYFWLGGRCARRGSGMPDAFGLMEPMERVPWGFASEGSGAALGRVAPGALLRRDAMDRARNERHVAWCAWALKMSGGRSGYESAEKY